MVFGRIVEICETNQLTKALIMRNEDLTPESVNDYDNIISINSDSSDSEEFDYDFDYDPNEMYYALNGIQQ